MGDVRAQSVLATLRSSPRKRRQLAWLVGGIVVLAVLVAVVLIVPNTGGKPTPATPNAPEPEAGTGPFWWVASILFICFLLALVLGLIRFVWRISVGDADEGAGSDGYTWRNPRKDLEDAMRSGSG